MKLIVGLGNPGPEYIKTRHNVGANLVEVLATQCTVPLSHHTMHAHWGRGYIQQETFVLARPQTYMNCSGQTVAALSRYFKIPPEQILIIVDDFNLPLGALRFRTQGSAGGHNGLKSIIERLGSQVFHRLRIGIDKPPAFMEITDYVLGRFSKDEKLLVQETLDKASEAARCWLEAGIARAMQEYN
ncbi:aminoacyl-tRNA hydrolase [bacterium]|nr:aminoacyl-tRNA hydrolase [bacterium]